MRKKRSRSVGGHRMTRARELSPSSLQPVFWDSLAYKGGASPIAETFQSRRKCGRWTKNVRAIGFLKSMHSSPPIPPMAGQSILLHFRKRIDPRAKEGIKMPKGYLCRKKLDIYIEYIYIEYGT